MNDDDLFRPLSAKVGRKKFAIGGREMSATQARIGDSKRVMAAIERAKKDAARRRAEREGRE